MTGTQSKILDALWPLLVPGGRMVYATCSLLKAENIAVIDAFVARTPDARVPPFGSAEHFQLFPREADADGFYYACLAKAEDG
jgi:16S rRNA (cytosine967-C5)-methyltransferase